MEENFNDFNERFFAVETKIAYLEDFVFQLQKVVVQNSVQIEKLENANRILKQKVAELSLLTQAEIPNRKPPHY